MLELKDAPATSSQDWTKDESLARRIELCLQQSGYPELQNLEVSQGYGRIVLGGRVRTYFLKQLAQSLILAVPGVTALENQVDVNAAH